MAVYRYHVGITFTAVFIVLLVFKTLNIVNPYQRSHSNFQTKRSGYSATTFRGLFDENRKSALTVQQFNPDKYVQHKSTEFDYKTELNNLLKQTTRADDPRLIHILRNYIIEQPSTEPYSLTHPEKLEFSAAQTPLVDSVLKYMEGGFYVECGALDGETSSNTLFLERVRKWNGLLIEANPSSYALLKSKHRKAFTVNAGLSITPAPSKVTFNKAFQTGRIAEDMEAQNWIKRLGIPLDPVEIECFPFYSLMLALNRTTVDFFSLDVEGDEFKVLKTIPFDKINIKMFTIEYLHEPGGVHVLQSFMESKGYWLVANIRRQYVVGDLIFIKNSLRD